MEPNKDLLPSQEQLNAGGGENTKKWNALFMESNWEQRFDEKFNIISKDGIIYGKEHNNASVIVYDEQKSQLGAIKSFISQLLDERTKETTLNLVEDMIKNLDRHNLLMPDTNIQKAIEVIDGLKDKYGIK